MSSHIYFFNHEAETVFHIHLPCDSYFPGITIIQNGERVAAKGDIRFGGGENNFMFLVLATNQLLKR